MRNIIISMNTKYIHGKINPIARDLAQVFSNVDCGNLYRKLEIREKTETKFTKPSIQSDVLCIVLGGWRLISQEREKSIINIKEWLGNATDDSLSVFVNKPSKGSQVIAYNGMVVAEVLDTNCINILTDLIKIKDSCDLKTYNKLINHIIYTYLGAFHDIDVERKLSEKKENSASSMHNLIMHIRKKNVESIKQEYEEARAEVQMREDDLIQAVKKRKEVAERLDLMSRVTDEDSERVRTEITRIMQLNHVIDLNVIDSEKKINVMTDDIYVRSANKRYYIGMFRIEINLSNNRVRFFNLNNCRRSYWGTGCNHPHVDPNGAPCWGNAGSPIRTLLAEGEFLAAVTMMLGYLESVNTSDPAGKNITRWDTVDEEGRVIIKGYDPSNPPEIAMTLTCSCCGKTRPMSEFEVRGHRGQNICVDCKALVVECADCGDYIDLEGANFDDETNRHYCDYCYEDLLDERRDMAQQETQQEETVEEQPANTVEISQAGVTINGELAVPAEHVHTPEFRDATDALAEAAEARVEAVETAETGGDDECQFCHTPVNDDMWMTCEVCGTQGCSTCISFDGIYKCPNCR